MIDTEKAINIEIANRINNRKKVIIVDSSNKDFVRMLCRELENHESNAEVWHLFEIMDGNRELHLSQDEMKDVLELYRLYDFSDKVYVISDYGDCGSLFNYVKTGILTEQEMVDALLYKI